MGLGLLVPGRELVEVQVHVVELHGVTDQVVELAIVVQRSSRPRKSGRFPLHLTTTVWRSLRPLETAPYFSVVSNLNHAKQKA